MRAGYPNSLALMDTSVVGACACVLVLYVGDIRVALSIYPWLRSIGGATDVPLYRYGLTARVPHAARRAGPFDGECPALCAFGGNCVTCGMLSAQSVSSIGSGTALHIARSCIRPHPNRYTKSQAKHLHNHEE